jgi:hypothetical protein
MKSVKICVKNLEKIQAILDNVQKRSKVRLIFLSDLLGEVKAFCDTAPITKKSLNGVGVFVNPFYFLDFPKAYKWEPYGTTFNVIFKNNAVYLVNISRNNVKSIHYRLYSADGSRSKEAKTEISENLFLSNIEGIPKKCPHYKDLENSYKSVEKIAGTEV